MLQVKIQRWIPENTCVDSSFESTRTEHIQRGAAVGAAPFVMDQTRTLTLSGTDCTLRSDSVGLPAEYEFIVRSATQTANGTSSLVFAPNTRIFVHTEPQDQLTPSLVTINNEPPTDAQLRFIRSFLMLERHHLDTPLARLNGVRNVGDRRSYYNTLYWPGFLPRQVVARYRGRITVGRIRSYHGIDSYELAEEAIAPATNIDVTGDGMQVHGVLQEEQHSRHIQPLDVSLHGLAFDDTIRKTFTGTVVINGQTLPMQSEEIVRTKHRFSRPVARTPQ